MASTATSTGPRKRTQILQLLTSLGIELPPDTKLSDEALEKRLKQAINAAQYLNSTIPSPPLNPSSLPKWERDPSKASTLMKVMMRQNFQESVLHYAARQEGRLNAMDLYADPLHDVRQTLMSLAKSWSEGYDCCVVQDVNKEDWAINIRILGVYKINDETPAIVLNYRSLTQTDRKEGVEWIKSVEKRGYTGLPSTYGTELERQFLIRLLTMNSKLLPADFKPERDETEKKFQPSFLIPVGPLSFEDLGKLNADHGCVLCGAPSKSRCSQCQSVLYCSAACQRTDWPDHKHACRSLKGGKWQTAKFSASPPGLEGMFMFQMNKFDELNKLSKTGAERMSNSQVPQNVHGDKLFLIKLQSGGMGMMVYDRLRSFQVFITNENQPKVYEQLMEEMDGPRGGYAGLKMYRWAKRTGDWEFSVCVDRQPLQDIMW